MIQSGWSAELQGWGIVISERSRQKPHPEDPVRLVEEFGC